VAYQVARGSQGVRSPACASQPCRIRENCGSRGVSGLGLRGSPQSRGRIALAGAPGIDLTNGAKHAILLLIYRSQVDSHSPYSPWKNPLAHYPLLRRCLCERDPLALPMGSCPGSSSWSFVSA